MTNVMIMMIRDGRGGRGLVLHSSYVLVRELAGLPVPGCGGGGDHPHGQGGQGGEQPAGQDTNFYLLTTCAGLVIHWELDSQETVQINKNKIVDGATQGHHNQTCYYLAEHLTKIPSKKCLNFFWDMIENSVNVHKVKKVWNFFLTLVWLLAFPISPRYLGKYSYYEKRENFPNNTQSYLIINQKIESKIKLIFLLQQNWFQFLISYFVICTTRAMSSYVGPAQWQECGKDFHPDLCSFFLVCMRQNVKYLHGKPLREYSLCSPTCRLSAYWMEWGPRTACPSRPGRWLSN